MQADGWTDRHAEANTRLSKFCERAYRLNIENTADLETKAKSNTHVRQRCCVRFVKYIY